MFSLLVTFILAASFWAAQMNGLCLFLLRKIASIRRQRRENFLISPINHIFRVFTPNSGSSLVCGSDASCRGNFHRSLCFGKVFRVWSHRFSKNLSWLMPVWSVAAFLRVHQILTKISHPKWSVLISECSVCVFFIKFSLSVIYGSGGGAPTAESIWSTTVRAGLCYCWHRKKGYVA